MALNLNRRLKLHYTSLVIVVILVVTVSIFEADLIQPNFEQNIDTTPLKEENLSTTQITASIIVPERNSKSPEITDSIAPQTINPTVIIRGNSFVSSGQLIDTSTGLGLSGEPIEVFWSYFTWSAYETDRTGLRAEYLVGEGTTGTNGFFSITCRDRDHSKTTGLVNVYSVFRGDPAIGPPILNRNYTVDAVECYATIIMGMQTNSTLVRVGNSFYAETLIGFDNYTAIPGIDGNNITFDWLGSQYETTIVSSYTNTIFTVTSGTPVGQYSLDASFNVSVLSSLQYVVGDINDEALIGTSAAVWTNVSTLINVFSGAGITFSIDDPIPPGPGEYPYVVKGETNVTISGLITDEFGGSFGYEIDLEIFVHTGIIKSSTYRETITTTDSIGNFLVTFTVTGSAITTGDHNVWVDVATGQGIIATTEYEQITIFGNSTITSTYANDTAIIIDLYRAMPGEIIEIRGVMRDVFDNSAIENMTVSAFWDIIGILYSDTTSATGAFTIYLPVSLTFDSGVNEASITLQAESTTYYDPSSVGFSVEIFTDVNFDINLNTTSIVESSTIDNVDGNTIYYNSSITLSGILTDQFDRGLERQINLTIEGILSTYPTLANGSFSYTIPQNSGIQPDTTYTVIITFKQDIDFIFQISFQDYPVPPTTESPTDTGTGTNTTPNGENNWMDTLLIGIMIAIVSGIIIVSVIYAFGRFKRSQKRPRTSDDVELPGLDVILKQIDESEQAKDFKRAVVLCYRAFEAICIVSFGILNARAQSPRELARLVAQTNRIPVRDTTMLVMRFEEARFSDHKVNKQSYTQARQALHNIQISLEQPKR
ncbi:MAG TPA: DUF4129 domain-containing protein [candidate division Zixibacteria bacterium]|nr:DUF4129 domain-containing protein [candidate division Zixibacteria bacterium]